MTITRIYRLGELLELPSVVSQIREALADYIATEGCSCCQNTEKHEEAAARLAKLLEVPRYSDGSGFDFYKFKSKKEAKDGRKTT